MNWHRVRRVVFGEPDANEYAKKKQELEVLKEQAAERKKLTLDILMNQDFP